MTQLEMEWMDAYIENKLSAEEKQRFEDRLAADARFAEDFEEQKFMRSTIYRYFKAREAVAKSRASLEAEGFFERTRRQAEAAAAAEKAQAAPPPVRPERPWYVYAFWTVLALITLILIVFFADLIRHVLS
jgi:anti-sigma factor RsiW